MSFFLDPESYTFPIKFISHNEKKKSEITTKYKIFMRLFPFFIPVSASIQVQLYLKDILQKSKPELSAL